jgi:hypothetical protein
MLLNFQSIEILYETFGKLQIKNVIIDKKNTHRY